MLAKLRIRRLRTRIVLFFVALLAAVQLATYTVVRDANVRIATDKIASELTTGEKIFQRSLELERTRLVQAARVLAADYAFREAIATRDEPTIRSALDNHAGRVGAEVSLVVGADRQSQLAASESLAGEALALDSLFATAADDGSAAGAALIAGRAYEIVVVPVLAPLPIAWIALGFPLDAAALADLREVSGLDVSLVATGGDRPARVLATTLDSAQATLLEQQLPLFGPAPPASIVLGDDDHQVRTVELAGMQGERRVVAILDRSLTEALAPFDSLSRILLLVASVALLLSLLGSIAIALGITRPLNDLMRSARRLRDGDYTVPIDTRRGDEVGELAQSLSSMRDGIAEREAEILRLAYVDTLTGLPNRARFGAAFREWTEASAATGLPGAVLVIDVDRFKAVNDVLGYAHGDALLCEVARRLQQLTRAQDVVARLGADEFAVLLSGADLGAAEAWVRTLDAALAQPFVINGQALDVRATTGIALCPDHGTSAAVLLRNADIAMNAGKAARRTPAIYDPRNETAREEHLSLLGELQQAIEKEQLLLYYQPKRRLRDGEIVGAEALIRWNHPTRGFMPPNQFIPFAEQTGNIRELTRWALRHALKQMAVWRAEGIDLTVSVNLSARDLGARDLPALVGRLLEEHGVPPSMLCLEITESGLMEDPEGALGVARELAALGVSLSIDDFGTGYSSLGYLARLPVSEVKIDRSFVIRMAEDQAVATVVRSTVELGHGLGLKVTAEGVETTADERLLREAGCDVIQGWLVAKPLPPTDFVRWLQRDAPLARAG